MATSLINRIATSLACRIRQNQRILSSSSTSLFSSSSTSAVPEDSPSPSIESIQMTDNCVKRMKELHTSEASAEDKNLRLRVEVGGCYGFQYAFSLDDKTNSDDRIFEKDGVKFVVDKISYDFVKGATVDYAEELIRSAFQHKMGWEFITTSVRYIDWLNGMVDCGSRHEHIKQKAMLLADQVRLSKGSPLMTCLLEGPSGSGKTALAATVGIDSDFPYVKIVSAESMIGLSEATKCARIVKVFEDAYRSPLSVIVLDDIERKFYFLPREPRVQNMSSTWM